MTNYPEGAPAVRSRRASPMGAYVTLAGVALFTIAVFLDWLSADIADSARVNGPSVSGYETDPLIPFVAYLGLGLAAALLYAMSRAHRRQHRGLTLTSMAVGIAATLLALSYLIDAPGISEGGRDLSPEIGVWLALIGGLLWAAGSGLFAKGDRGRRPPRRHGLRARPRSLTHQSQYSDAPLQLRGPDPASDPALPVR